MRTIFSISLVLALVALFALPAQAQEISLGQTRIFASEAFAASVVDTSGSVKVGGANRLALVTYVADSAVFDVYVDYSVDGTTWTNKLTDSIKATAAGWYEHSLIDSDSDLFDGVFGYARVRNSARATGNGVTSATFNQWFYYRQ